MIYIILSLFILGVIFLIKSVKIDRKNGEMELINKYFYFCIGMWIVGCFALLASVVNGFGSNENIETNYIDSLKTNYIMIEIKTNTKMIIKTNTFINWSLRK